MDLVFFTQRERGESENVKQKKRVCRADDKGAR